MTTSITKIDEQRDSHSDRTQDADWVMVKEEGQLTKEDFELIDAAEARCWCGGADADRCREKGHTWPLCDVDQEDLWPELPNKHCRSHQEQPETEGSSSTGDLSNGSDQSNTKESKETTRETTPKSETRIPEFYKRGTFTTLADLTYILEHGKYPRV